jgi:esterase
MKLNLRNAGTSGPEVVILHGLLGSSRNWQRVMRELSSEFRVMVPDLRNHGDSPHGPHSIASMRDDILELIQKNCDEPPHLIGHSMGAQAAMAVAASDETKIASLTVVDAAPVRLKGNLQNVLNILSKLELKSISSRAQANKAISSNIPDPGVRLFLLQNLKRKDTGELYWRCNLPELRRYVEEESFSLPEEAVYEGPTLVIAGGRSEYRVWEHEALLKAHFPAMTLEIIEEAGHWVHADAPERFLQLVREFIS